MVIIGETEVFVGCAITPVVAVGVAGSCVGTGGGLLAAGSLQAVMVNASIPSRIIVQMSFLFMAASLKPGAQILVMIFYIILSIALMGFNFTGDANRELMLGVIYPYGCTSLEWAVMFADAATDADFT